MDLSCTVMWVSGSYQLKKVGNTPEHVADTSPWLVNQVTVPFLGYWQLQPIALRVEGSVGSLSQICFIGTRVGLFSLCLSVVSRCWLGAFGDLGLMVPVEWHFASKFLLASFWCSSWRSTAGLLFCWYPVQWRKKYSIYMLVSYKCYPKMLLK